MPMYLVLMASGSSGKYTSSTEVSTVNVLKVAAAFERWLLE